MSCERFAEALWGLKAAVRPRNVEGDFAAARRFKLYGGCYGRYKVFGGCGRQGFEQNAAAFNRFKVNLRIKEDRGAAIVRATTWAV